MRSERGDRSSRSARAGRSNWHGDVAQGVRAWTGDRGGARPPEPPADPRHHAPDADPDAVARTIVLDQLVGRARSRHELSDKLAAKHVPDDVATRVLDRFEELGLIDDEAFARTWVAQRQSAEGGGRGLARRALAQELRRKGVDVETSREVLDDLDPDTEEAAARTLVRRKLRTLSRVDEVTATRRLVAMLARKGYNGGMAFAVVRAELGAAGREPLDDDREDPADLD